MEANNLRNTADQLVEMVGGYNLRTVIAVGLAGVAIGFLLGGLLGRQFGFGFLLLPVVICYLLGGCRGDRLYEVPEVGRTGKFARRREHRARREFFEYADTGVHPACCLTH